MLHLPVCGWNSKCKTLLPWRMKEPLSNVMDGFSPSLTVPTGHGLAYPSVPWQWLWPLGISRAIFPLGRYFLLICYFGWIMAAYFAFRQKKRKNSPKPKHHYPAFCDCFDCSVKFLKRFYLFIFRQSGREGEREGEKRQCVVASHTPPTGLKARHGPWPGIKQETLWFAGWHPIHWATPARLS